MPDFTIRSDKEEMMDDKRIPQDQLIKNLNELDWLNRHTGGHRISIHGLKRLNLKEHKIYNLVDLGCGSGDSMKYMAQWARKKNFRIEFTGVDQNEKIISYLKDHCRDFPEIKGVTGDALEYIEEVNDIDILHCSLFCHHMSDYELKRFFILLKKKIRIAVIVNDLQRNAVAYHSARWFTRLANGSRLSRNDGPLSVLKAFKKPELEDMLHEAGITDYRIESFVPFRYLLTIKTNS